MHPEARRRGAAALFRPGPHCWTLLALAAILVVVGGLYHAALSGYWRYDDGMHLEFATRHSPWGYFFDPLVTRAFSGSNLTPWNPFLYDVNLFLFGFSPEGFYWHHLASLAATALASFLLLRLWLAPGYALLGALLFLVGAPTGYVAQQLMVGHYLDGLLFSILALYAFVRAVRKRSVAFAVAGTLLYLLATSCKEVFVPLPGVLLFLPERELKARLRYAAPYFLWVAIYLLWRYQVLGGVIGGYDRAAVPFEPSAILSQMARLPLLLFGDDALGYAGLVVLGLLLLLNGWQREINWPLLGVCLVAILLPLVPLTLVPGIERPDRYLFLPWWGVSALVAVLLARLRKVSTAVQLLLGALVTTAAAAQGAHERGLAQPKLDLYDSVYRFALSGPPDRVLVQDQVPDPLYMDLVLNGAIAARAVCSGTAPHRVHILVDRSQLPLLAGRGYSLWEYDSGCRCVSEIAPGDAALTGQAPVIPARRLRVVSYGPPYPPLLSGVAGVVDRVRLDGVRISLAGWVNLKDYDPEQQLVLLTPALPRAIRLAAVQRPDVVAELAEQALLHSGFRITLTYSDEASAQRAARHLCLVTRSTLTSVALVGDPAHPECMHLLAGSGAVDE